MPASGCRRSGAIIDSAEKVVIEVNEALPRICGEDNRVYPSDDAPPYLTLLLVGHLIFPFMFWMDRAWSPELWIMFALWLPLITGLKQAP